MNGKKRISVRVSTSRKKLRIGRAILSLPVESLSISYGSSAINDLDNLYIGIEIVACVRKLTIPNFEGAGRLTVPQTDTGERVEYTRALERKGRE